MVAMYEVGSKVVYPLHGVGIISSIEEKTVLGKTHSYYIIKLGISDMTVMIPNLYHRNQIKELSIMEKKLYENAFRLLVDEIAFVLNIEKEQAKALIAERLENSNLNQQ